MNIAKIMTPKYNTICLQDTSTVRHGLELIQNNGYSAIPVLNARGQYVGSVTEGDFLRHIMRTGSMDMREHERCKVRDIFRPDFCPALSLHAGEAEVIDAVSRQNYVPIVDDRGCLCGIVTRRAVIAYLAEKKVDNAPASC